MARYKAAKAQPDPKSETLRLLDRYFFEAASHPISKAVIEDGGLDFQYYEGDQWTTGEKADLAKRNQQAIVENEIKPVVDRVYGQYKQAYQNIKFVGRNQTDDPLGWKQTALLRWIDQQNLHEFQEGQMVLDGLKGGRGVCEIKPEINDAGSYSIVERYEDTFTFFPDPYSRCPDWNDDARYICRAKWMDLDEAKMLWPDHASELENCLTDGYTPGFYATHLIDPKVLALRVQFYLNTARKLMRPVEVWYKKIVEQTWVMTSDGAKDVTDLPTAEIKKLANGQEPITRRRNLMYVGVFCAGVLLDHGPSPHRHQLYPFVPFFAFRKKNGEPYGLIRNLRSPQDEINHRRSRGLYMLNNRQVRFEQGAIKDQAALAEELAKADGQVVIEDGKFDRFAMNDTHDIGEANLQMMQESKQAIGRLSGEDHLQVPGEMRSGRGVKQMQQIYQLGNLQLADSIRWTRRIAARLKMEYVKQYITEQQEFLITEKPNKPQRVTVTKADLAGIQERIYDIVIEDTVDLQTTRQEQVETLMTNLPALAQHGPAMVTLGLSLVDFPERDALLKQYQSMIAPPPIGPKMSLSFNWSELTAIEKSLLAKQFGWQEIAAAEAQNAGGEPIHITKGKVDLTKTIIKTKAQGQGGDVAAVGQVTAHRADMAQQDQQHQHEMDMAAQQQAHEKQMQANESAPIGA